jgi:hypothetical protein
MIRLAHPADTSRSNLAQRQVCFRGGGFPNCDPQQYMHHPRHLLVCALTAQAAGFTPHSTLRSQLANGGTNDIDVGGAWYERLC